MELCGLEGAKLGVGSEGGEGGGSPLPVTSDPEAGAVGVEQLVFYSILNVGVDPGSKDD